MEIDPRLWYQPKFGENLVMKEHRKGGLELGIVTWLCGFLDRYLVLTLFTSSGLIG